MSNGKDLNSRELTELIEHRGQRVLQKFRKAVTSGVSDPKLLSVLNDVKAYWKDTFRPALASFSCEAIGGNPEAADSVSLMITLASAGGGVHDDIVDKSLNKHFRMTILGLHGLDCALLVGDLLIIKGWAMAHKIARKNCGPERLAEVLEVFGKWTTDVCEAEFMEVSCRRNLDTELASYQGILRQSMADVEGCAKLGAIMGGGSTEEVKLLAEFGSRLGFNFRLEDDVKDTLNRDGSLVNRLQYESVPLPVLFAAKSSREFYSQIKSVLAKSPIDPKDVGTLVKLCFETEAFSYAVSEAKQNTKEALQRLRMLKESDARNILALMIEKSYADFSKLCI